VEFTAYEGEIVKGAVTSFKLYNTSQY